jgi:anti-sigma regulatory factor (Ser/Thr protein kinase)
VGAADPGPLPHDMIVHAALIFDSDETLRRLLVPSLVRSLAAGQPVLMVVSAGTEQVVRAALGDRAAELQWGDTGEFYHRLGFAFDAFRRYVAAQHAAGRAVHVVTEPEIVPTARPGADEPVDRVAAYLSFESIRNDAYAGFGCPITCLWDSRRHPMLIIEDVRRLHTHELFAEGPIPNSGFIPPADYLAARNQIPLEPAPTAVDLALGPLDASGLSGLRAQLRAWAGHRGFSASAAEDVVIATSEVATNGLIHGAPPVRVRCWQQADTLIVQVDDAGGIPLPPLAGYQPPAQPPHRRGLWIARQLADVLTTYTTPDRTTVRLYFPHSLT